MSYFTETFESILEFKGDAELAYAKRRSDERMTHDHKYGKYASQYAKDNVNNNKHAKNYDAKSLSSKGHDIYDKKDYHDHMADVQKQKANSEHHRNDVERNNSKKRAEFEAKERAKADARCKRWDMHDKTEKAKDKAMSRYYRLKGEQSPYKHESFDPVYEDLYRMGIID